MQVPCSLDHRDVSNCDDWPQDDFFEVPAIVVVLEHHADRSVGVGRHDDAADRTTVQVREQVALAERRNKKEFRVPSRLVASEEGSDEPWIVARSGLEVS